jgi:hypothetical protein
MKLQALPHMRPLLLQQLLVVWLLLVVVQLV